MNWIEKRITTILTIVIFSIIFSVLLVSRSGKNQPFHFSLTPDFVGRIIVDWRSLADPNDPINCTTTQISNLTQIPICTYSADEDRLLSRDFLKGLYFAGPHVARLLALFRRLPGTAFVDIGANIGSFTLPAARLTSVVAVEPSSRSMARLAKAVELGGTSGNVTLVNNAISNRRGSFSFRIYTGNFGGNQLVRGERKCDNSSASCVHTILLDDLLPVIRTRNVIMKVDVEGHEALIFNDETASEFFSRLDVNLVFMEWVLVLTRPAVQVESLVEFFFSRKYLVLDPDKPRGTNRLSVLQYRSWPPDVLFVTREFDALSLL